MPASCSGSGDVFHAYAHGSSFPFFLKIGLARFYKLFLHIVQGLGFAVGILVLVAFLVTAGYYLLRAGLIDRPTSAEVESASILLPGDVIKEEEIFSLRRTSRHFPDRYEDDGQGLRPEPEAANGAEEPSARRNQRGSA